MKVSEFIYTVLLKHRAMRNAANRVIRALLPARVAVGSAWIHLNPSDPVISGALAFRVYERSEIAFFRSRFRPTMTLIDVGANVGLYTALALSTKGFDGRVLAIEPHDESRKFLQRTIDSNQGSSGGRVFVSGLAACDRAGPLRLHTNAENKGDNRLYPDPLLSGETWIQADTLDNISRDAGISSADFIKIDVQGAEALVLAGATQLLTNSADCILMSEFWPYGFSRCGSDSSEYLARLRTFGFVLYELSGSHGDLLPIRNDQELIARTQGRRYATVVGLKGRYCDSAV